MNLDIVVCPACRTATEGRIDVRTLERKGDILSCECGRRYPVVDEVPIVMAHPHAYLRSEIATVVERMFTVLTLDRAALWEKHRRRIPCSATVTA